MSWGYMCMSINSHIRGGGISGLSVLKRYMILLKFDAGRLRQATSDVDGTKVWKKSPPSLIPIVTPLSHSIKAQL